MAGWSNSIDDDFITEVAGSIAFGRRSQLGYLEFIGRDIQNAGFRGILDELHLPPKQRRKTVMHIEHGDTEMYTTSHGRSSIKFSLFVAGMRRWWEWWR